MRYPALVIATAFVFGCASKPRDGREHLVEPVVLAVNLRLENERDLKPIEQVLALAGIPFYHNRVINLNELPLWVSMRDFEQAKMVATDAIVSKSLTARLYVSPSVSSLLEVWEKGQKTRVEPHRGYNPTAAMGDYPEDSTAKSGGSTIR